MLLPFFKPDLIEAGCDEAGRGCLAGPVVAAAVILPANFHHPLLNDSKKLSENDREALVPVIQKHALAWSIGISSSDEIDQINILKASFLAMHRALDQLTLRPDHIIVDGNRFTPYQNIPHDCIIKGDGKYNAIAAASVLAKTHRDAIMRDLHVQHPVYNWKSNKGYPSLAHRSAIACHGITEHHRKSFQLLPRQLELFK